jgi:hypothetical protein
MRAKWRKIAEERQVPPHQRALRGRGISVMNIRLVWFSLCDGGTVAGLRRAPADNDSSLDQTLTA